MPEDIALFIDFENIRYSMLNIQRREPDPTGTYRCGPPLWYCYGGSRLCGLVPTARAI